MPTHAAVQWITSPEGRNLCIEGEPGECFGKYACPGGDQPSSSALADQPATRLGRGREELAKPCVVMKARGTTRGTNQRRGWTLLPSLFPPSFVCSPARDLGDRACVVVLCNPALFYPRPLINGTILKLEANLPLPYSCERE